MEVKPGYKQTEVGVIPQEWRLRKLVELIDPARGVRYGIVQPGKYDALGRYMVRGQDYSDGWVEPSELFRVSPQVEEPFKNARIKAGDVLITIVGASTGRIAITPDWLEGGNLTQTTARLAFCPNIADSRYCAFVLGSWYGSRQVANYVKGGAQPGLNCGDIEKFLIPLPPTTDEQRAIAAALSDADELLGGLDRLIAKKRDLKQAAMQELLTGHTRLPGFHAEWGEKRLGELFEITSSKRVFQSEWKSKGVPFYRARELAVLGETGRVDNELFITRELYEKHRRAYGVPQIGDMLVTGVGTLGKVYVVSDDSEFYFKDGNIIWFKIEGKMSAEFLRQLYLTETVQRQVADGGAGTTVGTYTISAAKKTTIPFPTLAEQTAIAEVLTSMDAELAALEHRREKTRLLKQGMMQELLTGKTRLI